MTPERALRRVEDLLRLAASGSGASVEETRSAAVAAVRLMSEHGLRPAAPAAAPSRSVIDINEVTRLALRVMELEHLLADRHDRHRQELRDLEAGWRQLVENVRHEERAAGYAKSKAASRKAAVKERTEMARQGGRARDKALSPERKAEIARTAASTRWARWREQRQG